MSCVPPQHTSCTHTHTYKVRGKKGGMQAEGLRVLDQPKPHGQTVSKVEQRLIYQHELQSVSGRLVKTEHIFMLVPSSPATLALLITNIYIRICMALSPKCWYIHTYTHTPPGMYIFNYSINYLMYRYTGCACVWRAEENFKCHSSGVIVHLGFETNKVSH